MNRQLKIARVAQRAEKVSKVTNLEVRIKNLDPKYRLEHCDGILGKTGKLEVLKVIPKSGNGPFFIARWDQGPEHLDIDMRGASDDERIKFKRNEGGYSGHHTTQPVDPHKRLFVIEIRIPGRVIFDGDVSFSIVREMRKIEKASFGDNLDAELIKADQK